MALKSILKAVLLVVTSSCFAVQGRADSVAFSYQFFCGNCGPFVGNSPAALYWNASGVLTTTHTPVNGAVTITSITGTRSTNFFMNQYSPTPITLAIGGLIPPDPSNPYGLVTPSDNLLYETRDPHLDLQGFAYTLSGSYAEDIVQFTGQFPGTYAELGPVAAFTLGTATFTPIPEPKPITALALAALAVLFWSRYRIIRSPETPIHSSSRPPI